MNLLSSITSGVIPCSSSIRSSLIVISFVVVFNSNRCPALRVYLLSLQESKSSSVIFNLKVFVGIILP